MKSDALVDYERQVKDLETIIEMQSTDKHFIANAILTAGYRKVKDGQCIVPIEFLTKIAEGAKREILQELYDMCFEIADPEGGGDEIKRCVTYDDILDYANGMGVTIDE